MNSGAASGTQGVTSIRPQGSVTGFDWQYIKAVALEHRRELLLANLIAALATFANVPIPLFMPMLVDEVLLGQPGVLVGLVDRLFPADWRVPALYIGCIFVVSVCLRLLSLMFSVWQSSLFLTISKDIVFRMRRQLLSRLQHISMAEYETLGSGAVASHLVTDLDTVDTFISKTLSQFLVAILTITGVAVILLWMHWKLALFILFFNPLVIYFTTVLGKKVKRLKQRESAAYGLFQESLTETLEAIQQIKSSNREKHYVRDLVDKARGVKQHSIAFEWKSEAAGRMSFVIFQFGMDVFRAVSMLMVIFSDLSVGQMFAVFGYLWFMMGPVQEVLNIQYAYYGANGALQRINRLFKLRDEPQYPHLNNPFEGKQSVAIEVRDIRFGYDADTPVLNGISLLIPKGEKIALVGASGGGKSTLVQVLLGLYPADHGQVLFDNVPITEIGLDVVRENVVTVLQHPALFNDTIRHNLTLGRDVSDPELWHALEVAQLKDTISLMEDKLDTVVGRDGIRLSGGQRQRLAIARMILSDPKVVILDEATSALDARTEYSLHQAMSEFLKGRTTLIVAHRLSAVKQADHVYVFEDGLISEQGQHEELIRQRGLYAKLYGEYQA